MLMQNTVSARNASKATFPTCNNTINGVWCKRKVQPEKETSESECCGGAKKKLTAWPCSSLTELW
jgi:hypothetical protein